LKKVVAILGIICLSFTFVLGVYVADYYHAKHSYTYYVINARVKISHEGDITKLSNNAANDKAIIFYPGGKVEAIAYLPFLETIALEGYDCYLIKMPLNLAVFDIDAADQIIENTDYNAYYLAGHSLGGAMASEYAYENQDKLAGLFLMGAYVTQDFSDTNFLIREFIGDNDLIINSSDVDNANKYFSSNSALITIVGGNHSNFGDYGLQANDGEALISASKQAQEVATAITDAIKEQ